MHVVDEISIIKNCLVKMKRKHGVPKLWFIVKYASSIFDKQILITFIQKA